jgi:AcrR family transcriptional regulator
VSDAPRERDATATVARLVETARGLLEREGVNGLSLRRVASLAGVSLGTVQHYFASRQAMIEGCLAENDRWLDRLVSDAGGVLGGDAAPTDQAIEFAIRAAFRVARERRAFVRLRLMTIVSQGDQSSGVSALFRFELVDRLVTMIGGPVVDRVALGLEIQTVIFIAGRYALLTDGEIAKLTGSTDVAAGLQRLEDHVVAQALDVIRKARAARG